MPRTLLDDIRGILEDRRNIRTLLIVMGVSVALALAVRLMLPPRYVAETSILLDPYSDLTGLLGLVQGSDMLPSGAFGGTSKKENGFSYALICQSRNTLNHLLSQPTGRRTGETYLDVYSHRQGDQSRRREAAIERMRKSITTKFDNRSGVFQISVSDKNGAIAAAVANLLTDELRRFNAEVKSSRARDAVVFIRGRVQEARQSLNEAENQLAAFRSANARIGNAPHLLLQEARLVREVQLNENVYALVSRQFELAQIQEKNEASVFTTMDPAIEPTRPKRLSLLLTVVLSASLSGAGFVLGKAGRLASRLDRGDSASDTFTASTG